jgi:hypothetical protein
MNPARRTGFWFSSGQLQLLINPCTNQLNLIKVLTFTATTDYPPAALLFVSLCIGALGSYATMLCWFMP